MDSPREVERPTCFSDRVNAQRSEKLKRTDVELCEKKMPKMRSESLRFRDINAHLCILVDLSLLMQPQLTLPAPPGFVSSFALI